MNQKLKEQFNKYDMSLLEEMDELLESAELDLQRTATLLELGTDSEQAFEGLLDISKKLGEMSLQIKQEDVRMIASEKIEVFKLRFNEVMSQVKN